MFYRENERSLKIYGLGNSFHSFYVFLIFFYFKCVVDFGVDFVEVLRSWEESKFCWEEQFVYVFFLYYLKNLLFISGGF